MARHVEGDVYDIASRVQELNPALSLHLDYVKGRYVVAMDGRFVMSVQPGELDARVLERLRWGDGARRRFQDFMLELEGAEDRAEETNRRDMARQYGAIAADNYRRIAGNPLVGCGHWEG